MVLTKRNNGIFYISYRENGKQFRFSTNTKDKKLALDIFKQFQLGNIKSKKETKKVTETIKKHSVHFLIMEYLKHGEKHFTPETMVSVKSHFKTLTKSTPQNMDINDLDFQALNKIVINQVSVYQSLLCRNYLNMFFNWLILNEYYKNDNPVTKIKKPKIIQKLPVFFSVSELDLILNQTKNLNNDISKLVHDITLFAFFTGFRLGEITSLQWSQVDFLNKTIKLDNQTSKTKSGKFRVVPISSKILPMLEVRYNQKTTTMVFEHNFSTNNFNDLISKSFKKCIKKLPELNQSIHFHSCRHSHCSALLINNKVSIFTVSKLLGHSKISTTMVYSHINDLVLREAIDTL